MILKIKNIAISDFLIAILLIFLPFAQALSINIGFPIKISEIALILLAISALSYKIEFLQENKRIYQLLSLFILWNIISIIINANWDYDYELDYNRTRFNPLVDSTLKIAYTILSIVCFAFLEKYFRKNRELFIKCLLFGAVLSGIYSWYLFLSGVFNLPEYFLPGMTDDPQRHIIGGIVRCGTFKEGNYLGLFLLIMAIVSSYQKKYIYFIFFSATIITSFSTTAIILIIIYWTIYISAELFLNKKYKTLLSFAALFICAGIYIVSTNNIIKHTIFTKITGDQSIKNKQSTYSKEERTASTIAAFKLALDNPIIGVGISNYSLHFKEYYTNLKFKNEGYIPKKPIQNNVYAEIFSESGFIGLVLFCSFLGIITYKAFQLEIHSLGVGMCLTLIYFIAFPTFTMLYLWIFYAFIVSTNNDRNKLTHEGQ